MTNKIDVFNWRSVIENIKIASIDQDLILIEDAKIFPDFSRPFKVDVTTAVICLEGFTRGSINLKQYEVKAPSLFIVLSDQILQHEYISDDFKGLFIVMSDKFLNSLSFDLNERFPVFLSVQDNPSIPFGKDGMKAMLDYYKMIKRAINVKENPYRLEIVKHLTMAFFYGLGHLHHKKKIDENKSKQEVLVENFLKLVNSNFKHEREIEFYADKLFLTPKYLSKVVKETSGKSAAEWISNHVILEAKALLGSTNLTIQQISEELNFPSQSYFGKYFKRLVGVSPREYKKN